MQTKPTIVERFLSKVSKTPECWVWTAFITHDGYGLFNDENHKRVRAHRFAYQMFVGEIPLGLDIDHLCRVRKCVRPDHLQAVSHQENIRRSIRPPRETCRNGHRWLPENIYNHPRGIKLCRLCALYRNRRIRAEKRDLTATDRSGRGLAL